MTKASYFSIPLNRNEIAIKMLPTKDSLSPDEHAVIKTMNSTDLSVVSEKQLALLNMHYRGHLFSVDGNIALIRVLNGYTIEKATTVLTRYGFQDATLVCGEANIKFIEDTILKNKQKQYVGDMIYNDRKTNGLKGAMVKYHKYKGIILCLFICCIRNNSKLIFLS